MKFFNFKRNEDGSFTINIFPKDDIKKDKPKITKSSVLLIYLTNGKVLSFEVKPVIDDNYLKPWMSFYKWYYFRKSPAYAIKYNGGLTTIRRDTINHFNIAIKYMTNID